MVDKNNNLYKNKYRLESIRLKNWDYSLNGHYFITICTKEKQHFFGNIENGKIILNEIGKIAEKFWLEIPEHFFDVKLDEFLIMPNHIHGILVIDKNKNNMNFSNVDTLHCVVESLQCNNSTIDIDDKFNPSENDFYSKISPKPKSISTIIRSYKSICTKTINRMQNEVFFSWQSKFYDHIIRDEKALDNIRKYIKNNPLNCDNDSYN